VVKSKAENETEQTQVRKRAENEKKKFREPQKGKWHVEGCVAEWFRRSRVQGLHPATSGIFFQLLGHAL